MKNKILKDTLILFLITVIAGGLLGYVYSITKEPIKAQENKTIQLAYKEVFKDGKEFKETSSLNKLVKDSSKLIKKSKKDFGKKGIEINKALQAYDNKNKLLGYVITVTSKNGYGGDIKITCGINTKGKVTGVEILTINETAGLGMNTKNETFRKQYYNKNVDRFEVNDQNSDNSIDALSGATITSKAFTNGVNGALYFYSLIGGN
ncbi:MAG: RnfABCDGE type electron transport complex subunit G [Thomasclavelia sp.]|nr:RnfABCDGE type electron transport complex subunit G [Thomasclavelia sp.]